MNGHLHSHHVGERTASEGPRSARHLAAALVVIVIFMALEVVIGIIASSLALISDAGHMLTDAAAIALALIAARLAARPAKGNLTYGLKRVEILSAQANGITLLLLSAWFVYEAIRRLVRPPDVAGGLVLATALAGVAVNLVVSWLVARADRTKLNVEGAFQHILNDLFAFLATALAGLVILLTGWWRADAIAAMIVAALMVTAGWRLIRESWRIFLEAAPRGTDVASIDHDLHSVDGVVEVHDLHVWEVASGFPALSAHVLVDTTHDCHERREIMSTLLRDRYGLNHTTLQVDHAHATIVTTDQLRQTAREAGGRVAEPPVDR